MLNSGRKWGKQYRKDTDKLIEEVIYTTEEEFHAYYKARDERYFGLIEGLKLETSDVGLTSFR